jgi:hypothetical protein
MAEDSRQMAILATGSPPATQFTLLCDLMRIEQISNSQYQFMFGLQKLRQANCPVDQAWIKHASNTAGAIQSYFRRNLSMKLKNPERAFLVGRNVATDQRLRL